MCGAYCCSQLAAGMLFGFVAGKLFRMGCSGLANVISTLVLVLTILDHVRVVNVPWGYKGPGTEPERFRGGVGPAGACYELFFFLANNLLLYATYVFFFAVGSGHLVFFKGGRFVSWMTPTHEAH